MGAGRQMKAFPMSEAVDVEHVDPVRGVVILSNGDVLSIDHWLDDEGNDCDPLDAMTAIAQDDDNVWWVELCEEVTMQ
jgi:hypothetical protein